MEQILVLEDDENFREVIADLLDAEGYQVTAVGSAQEAIEIARRQDFHLLLTDVRLGGMDGVSALEAIKARAPHLKCIVMTGFADLEVPVRAARLQAEDYLTKPFELAELSRTVRSVLDREETPPPTLLRKVLSSRGNFWRWLNDKQLQQLQELRKRFAQRLFLLMRSGRISPEEAHPIFNRFASSEREFLKNDPALWTSLSESIQELEKLLLNSIAGQRVEAAELVPRAAFRRLYERVRAGTVEPEHFERSLALWFSADARKADLEAYSCYCRIWEEDAQRDEFIGTQVEGLTLQRLLVGAQQARLYETGAGRVLCLPASPENEAFFQQEVSSGRASYLGNIQSHHLLHYRKASGTSLKRRMRPGAMPPEMAWHLLKPVFLAVRELHSQGLCCGCFGTRHVLFDADNAVHIEGFGPERWRGLALTGAGQPGDLFLAAPELAQQASPSPAADQFVLARIFGEAVVGALSPVASFHRFSHLAEDEPLGPYGPALRTMLDPDPARRFKGLSEAITAMQTVN
ncbi:MAG: response regulator [Candidatus Eremiobacteraeota bacterium]|nr:response regulator [Candidatus Eremiobacteraeota bacterium]